MILTDRQIWGTPHIANTQTGKLDNTWDIGLRNQNSIVSVVGEKLELKPAQVLTKLKSKA